MSSNSIKSADGANAKNNGKDLELGKKQVDKAEDIFAEVPENSKPPAKPPVLEAEQPVVNAGQKKAEATTQESATVSPIGHRLFRLAIIAGGLILVGVLGYWAYQTYLSPRADEDSYNQEERDKKPAAVETERETDTAKPADQPSVTIPEQEPDLKRPDPADPLDSDQDGLTDAEENVLGTNINSADSDRDGLFDREEVRVYKTNPLVPDTDGDGFLDGDEVKQGFNPKGAGRLYELD